MDGRRYLRKHLVRPWRYNFGRFCRALVQAAHPQPAALPPPPHFSTDGAARNNGSRSGGKDWDLFDPAQP